MLDGSPGNGTVVSLTVTDTFAPAPYSVRIDTAIEGSQGAPPFTSAIQTGLFFPNQSLQVWMPWGCVCLQAYA